MQDPFNDEKFADNASGKNGLLAAVIAIAFIATIGYKLYSIIF